MQWFLNLTIRVKLFLGFGLMLVLLATVSVTAYRGIRAIQESQARLYQEDFADVVDLKDIRSNQNGTRAALLTMMSLAKRSDQERWHQEIKDRYRLGLYGPPSDPEVRKKVLKMLEDTIVEDIYSDDRLDESNAQRENKAMVEGRLARARPFDNHELHLRLHNHHRKLYEVEQITARYPEVDVLFERHEQEHVEQMGRQGGH